MTPEPPAASAHDHVKGHDINGECHACADEPASVEAAIEAALQAADDYGTMVEATRSQAVPPRAETLRPYRGRLAASLAGIANAARQEADASYDRQTENMRHWIARYEEAQAALAKCHCGARDEAQGAEKPQTVV